MPLVGCSDGMDSSCRAASSCQRCTASLRAKARRSPHGAYDHRRRSRKVDLSSRDLAPRGPHRYGKRLSRDRFLPYLAQQPPATVLLEACGSSHHWARQLAQFGHVVRLLPAHDVHRYVRRNKTDAPTRKPCSRRRAMRRFIRYRSRRSSTRRSRRYTVSARRGWPRARPGSTPCGACSASLASSFRSAPRMS